MNYLSIFQTILNSATDRERAQNQLLSDLNLSISEFKDNLKTYETFMDELHNSDQGLNNRALYNALEYNNALLLSSLKPDNFMDLLKKAVEEKRYYFFLTASEIILATRINPKLKTELISYVNNIKEKLGLTLDDFRREIYDEIIIIVDKMLEIAIDNLYIFRKISTKVIDPFISVHDPDCGLFVGEITLDDLKTLYREIIRYAIALGLKK